MKLISRDTAKRDLKITNNASDPDIDEKIELASGIVADYCKRDLSAYAIGGSNHIELPEAIKSATMLALRALFDGGDPLNDTVKALLWRQRDPAMA